MKRATFLLCLVLGLSNCVMNQKITYKTKDIKSISEPKLANIVIDIENFIDKRKDNPENSVLFTKPRNLRMNKKDFCINSEKHYVNESVSKQITNLLAMHIEKHNAFKRVFTNKKDSADYYITGNLTMFYGKQDYSTGAAVGASFGLIGALATMGIKTNGKIEIEIAELKLFDKNKRLIKNFGTVKKEYTGDLPADAYCWCIFWNINDKLKECFSELTTNIETEILRNQ